MASTAQVVLVHDFRDASQADRVTRLCRLAVELQRCGPMYLAALLVEEAYGRESLRCAVLDNTSLDVAAIQVDERLRRIALPPIVSVPYESRADRRRRERKSRKVAR